MNHGSTVPVLDESGLAKGSLPPRVELTDCKSLSFEDDELAELAASHHGTATMLSYLGINLIFAWILRFLAPALALRGAARRWRGEFR